MDCRLCDRQFQAAGPECTNVRSPSLVLAFGLQYDRPSADRKPGLVALSAVDVTMSRIVWTLMRVHEMHQQAKFISDTKIHR